MYKIVIPNLIDFYIHANLETYKEIWGDSLGRHLWYTQWDTYSNNLITFLNYLGKDIELLYVYLENKYK